MVYFSDFILSQEHTEMIAGFSGFTRLADRENRFYESCKSCFSDTELFDFKDITITGYTEPPRVMRIGNAVVTHEQTHAAFPLLIPFQDCSGLVIAVNEENRQSVNCFIQITALRLISWFSADALTCHFADIGNFGASFPFISGLHKKIVRPESLVTGESELGKLLNEYSDIAKTIIHQRLTYKFENLAQYNRTSGNIEPYHILFVADFPKGFSRDRIDALARIIQNASKVGMYVIMSYDKTISGYGHIAEAAAELVQTMPMITDINEKSCQINQVEHIGELAQMFDLKLDGIHTRPEISTVENRIAQINQHCEGIREQGIKEDGIRIPIGRKGHEPHYFTLGYDSNVYHALVGGETGSGKTMLLHNIIVRSREIYSPEQLQFCLLDYKEGTEFNVYRGHPNVKFLSAESSIESGIGILKKMQASLSERGELFRTAGVNHISKYNQTAEKKLPRILLIIDEFQKLLEGNFKIAKEVNLLLEDIAKRGRSFGIHLLLSSQSLINTQLEKTTMNQIGLRIVFKIHKSECPRFLDYDNEEPAKLMNKGEAVYNTRSGLRAGNEKIQVDYLDERTIPARIGLSEP